ncbi:MAG: DUF72 domain-containing protein [Deltaproteobacteria bacterium]|nr:DUF72 domain-containing protein [Deltaproteobacteria bacterium]
MNKNVSSDLESFRFRGLHPLLLLGTASDRYAGWIGQIYTRERWAKGIARRTKTVGGKVFQEEVLPVPSVREYFAHFQTLEIDFTFYAPLRDDRGEPTRVFHLLRRYAQYLQPGDRLVLKASQAVFARRLYRQGVYMKNADYLNPEVFVRQFYEPALELLHPWLDAIVFEQEYQKKDGRTPPARAAGELDAFFRAVPADDRYHVELRTQSLLTRPVLEVLEKWGVGQVLSHWTWLPPLWKQFLTAERRFLNAGSVVVRLMTPRGVRYEDAYAQAHPFNALVEGMQTPGMVEDTVRLIKAAVREGKRINVIVNNRAGGNAPLMAQQIARAFLAGHSAG